MDPLMTQKIGEAIHDDYVRQAARDRLGRQAQSGDRTPRAGAAPGHNPTGPHRPAQPRLTAAPLTATKKKGAKDVLVSTIWQAQCTLLGLCEVQSRMQELRNEGTLPARGAGAAPARLRRRAGSLLIAAGLALQGQPATQVTT